VNKEEFKCPTCDGYIPSNEHVGEYMGAISRADNETEICSNCGEREALEDFARWYIHELGEKQ
jgi:hypothetical protein